MRNSILKSLFAAFLYPGVGGSGAPTMEDTLADEVAGGGGFIPTGDDVEKEFLSHMMSNDAEYQEIIKETTPGGDKDDKEEAPTKTDGEDKKDEKEEPTNDGDAPSADAKDGDNWIDADGNEYEKKGDKWLSVAEGKELVLPEKKESESQKGTEDDDEYEYPDDVIPGLKGKHFASMPVEAQQAIAKYHSEISAVKESISAEARFINSIKNDPVAKHRYEMVKAGRQFEEYALPTVTSEEAKKILDTSTPEEAAKLINRAAQRVAATARDNERIRIEKESKIRELNTTGEQILRDAGNMHPDIKEDERIASFDNVENPNHPSKKVYDNYHQKIVDFCTSRSMKYADIAKMKPQELYALVAVNEGWPVSFNTQKRDTKMLTEHMNKALDHFRRSKRGKEVAKGMRSVADSSGKDQDTSGGFKVNGIDVVRLTTDENYHNSVLHMKPGSTNWVDKVREMRMKGEEIIERRKRKRNTA